MAESPSHSPLLEQQEKDWNEDEVYLRDTRRNRRSTRLLICSNIVLFVTLCILALTLSSPSWRSSLNADLKRVSYYSPMLDDVLIPLEETEHDNTLYAHSQYAQQPSPKVDRVWDNIANPRMLLVDSDTVHRVGKDPEYTVQHPKYPGKHIALTAVNHQLHCLNSLRKNLFQDYYYPDGSSSPLHMDHLHHCVDLLRQTLMCNANLELIMYEWWELALNPVPNFKVNMKCRNYDAILAWEDRPVEESGFIRWYEDDWMDGWERQGGEKNVSAPRQWWDLQLSEGRVSKEDFRARWGDD